MSALHFRPRRAPAAFTLVELLVVIAIIGILVALLLPAVQSAREAARRLQCANNVKQLALAVHGYNQSHQKLPYGNIYLPDNRPPASWATLILPYMERQAHFDLFDFSQVIGHANNAAAQKLSVPMMICPSDPRGSAKKGLLPARCMCCPAAQVEAMALWYTACAGPVDAGGNCPMCPSGQPWCCQGDNYGKNGDGPGMFVRWKTSFKRESVRDGLSNTIMIGETLPWQTIHNAAFGVNMSIGVTNVPMNFRLPENQLPVEGMSDSALHSRNPHTKTGGYKSEHSGGAMFALGDGSVHFVNDSIDFQLYNALGTRNGHETASLP
jgi:prepilin-type N-terminal cleavage/methylation domain-containing protein